MHIYNWSEDTVTKRRDQWLSVAVKVALGADAHFDNSVNWVVMGTLLVAILANCDSRWWMWNKQKCFWKLQKLKWLDRHCHESSDWSLEGRKCVVMNTSPATMAAEIFSKPAAQLAGALVVVVTSESYRKPSCKHAFCRRTEKHQELLLMLFGNWKALQVFSIHWFHPPAVDDL